MLRRLSFRRSKPKPVATQYGDSYYLASQWQLMWRKFRRHRLAMVSLLVVVFLYSLAIFAEFFAINDHHKRHVSYAKAPPQALHFVDEQGTFHIVPFIYELNQKLDMDTLQRIYTEDTSNRYHLKFFVRGTQYKLLGVIETDVHLVGVDEPAVYFPFGTDELGRGLYSRTIIAARVSLSIGFLGVVISFCLGCFFGGISGYFGGTTDLVVQRVVEFPHINSAYPAHNGAFGRLARSMVFHRNLLRHHHCIIDHDLAWAGPCCAGQIAGIARGRFCDGSSHFQHG